MTLKQWVLHGPADDDGTLRWFVATGLHWRLWAATALVFAPPFAGFKLLAMGHPGWAVVATWIVAHYAASLLRRIDND